MESIIQTSAERSSWKLFPEVIRSTKLAFVWLPRNPTETVLRQPRLQLLRQTDGVQLETAIMWANGNKMHQLPVQDNSSPIFIAKN